MAGPANKPNGTIVAYYGNATSCIKHLLDVQDYRYATARPDAALWATSPQSGTIVDLTNPAATFKNGCYRGYE
jgi:hypothetical protein